MKSLSDKLTDTDIHHWVRNLQSLKDQVNWMAHPGEDLEKIDTLTRQISHTIRPFIQKFHSHTVSKSEKEDLEKTLSIFGKPLAKEVIQKLASIS